MNGPASAASRNPWRLSPRRLPGNALPPKSAKSAGMATSPTMACCTACLLPLHWPEAWSRSGSGMGRSRCGRRANSLWSWPSAPGPRRMSSTRTNFAMWPQLPLAGRKSFPWAICGPRQRCRRASFPSMTSSVVWRCSHAAVKTTGPHATGTGITGPL